MKEMLCKKVRATCVFRSAVANVLFFHLNCWHIDMKTEMCVCVCVCRNAEKTRNENRYFYDFDVNLSYYITIYTVHIQYIKCVCIYLQKNKEIKSKIITNRYSSMDDFVHAIDRIRCYKCGYSIRHTIIP